MKDLLKTTALSVSLTAVLATAPIFQPGAEAAMKERVTFESNGQTLVGNLYLPDTYQAGDKLPAIVVTGAWTTVKEQMPATYAEEMADRGFAALTFDFRGWGESDEAPLYLEHPARKTADINAAVDFLATLPQVDPARIGGLGICASSGYMSDAAYQNDTIKSFALVAPWLHNAEIVEATYGGAESVEALIAAGREAEASNEPVYLEAASMTNENAVMYQAPYYTETDRGLIEEYDNLFNAASWEAWLTYDAVKTADVQTKPALLVHSDAAAIPQGARAYQARIEAQGADIDAVWLPDVTQFDFYDDPSAVETSSNLAAAHFAATLN